MWWHMYNWWGGWLSIILGLVFWAAVVVAIVFLVRWAATQRPQPGPGGPDALEILRQRYARGEITREQYQQMKADLEAPKTPGA